MPRFNSIKFYQNRPKIKLVFVKNRQNFRALGAPPPDPRNPIPLQIFGYPPESNHVFALLIFMPPYFSLMPDFESINFYQNKAKIKLLLQKKKFFLIARGSAPKPPMVSGGMGGASRPQKETLPHADFWLLARYSTCDVILNAHTSSCRILQ